MIRKVFFFPDAARDAAQAALDRSVNYIGILGTERTSMPYLETPLESNMAARFVHALSAPGSEYVVALKQDQPPQTMCKYLAERRLAFNTKREVHLAPSSVLLLAVLGKQVRHTKYHVIFRTRSLEDIRWTVAKYGSMDRMRVFVAGSGAAQQVAAALTQDSAQLNYDSLLDLADYHMLFDYEWEYFFVLTRKSHVGHVVSWLRRACHELGVETETNTEAEMIRTQRSRLERLTGLSLFQWLARDRPV